MTSFFLKKANKRQQNSLHKMSHLLLIAYLTFLNTILHARIQLFSKLMNENYICSKYNKDARRNKTTSIGPKKKGKAA